MAGYRGKSMSNNAVSAYSSGKMPLSKWTKKAIIEEAACFDEEKSHLLDNLTVSELKRYFLIYSEWHHTSKFYNPTDFYEFDFSYFESFDLENVKEIIGERKPRVKREKSVIEAEKIEKARKKAIRACDRLFNECGIYVYLNNNMLDQNSTEDINKLIELMNMIKGKYNNPKIRKTIKYKTFKGYAKNELKGISTIEDVNNLLIENK